MIAQNETSFIHPTVGLWSHQSEYLTRHAMKPNWFLFWEPRVGKSRAIMRGIVRWVSETKCRKIIIVAQKTICSSVWGQEEIPCARPFFPCALEPNIIPLYDGSIKQRQARLLNAKFAFEQAEPTKRPVQIALVNREALRKLEHDLWCWGPDAIVLDECHDYASPSSDRSLAALKLARVCMFRRGLTGTPTPNGYAGLYGQYKIIAPEVFGTNKKAFDERYIIWDYFGSRAIGYKHAEELKSKAFSIATVKTQAECIDVPPRRTIERVVEMPPKVRAMYDKAVKEHIVTLDNGQVVELNHTLTRMLRLHEIATGFLRNREDGHTDYSWLHNAKLDAVVEDAQELAEEGKKLVVFHTFRPEGIELARRLKDLTPLLLNGDTPGKERAGIIERFKTDDNYPVIIVQESTGSHGISLAVADYTTFISWGMKHDDHKQAKDRTLKEQNADGTVKLVTTYVVVDKSIDRFTLRLLENKQTLETYFMTGEGTFRDKFLKAAYGG